MKLRYSRVANVSFAAVAAFLLATGIASAQEQRDEGPSYTYVGASYEWTDVKYATEPGSSAAFNNGDLEGFNLDASLGILPWLHVFGQYFDGDCNDCGLNQSGSTTDLDFSGYQIGLGYNQSMGFFGPAWDATDFVLRASFIDAELDNIDDDGWSAEAFIRSQISERADIGIGYRYQDVGDAENRDLVIDLAYRVWNNLAFTASGIVFDDDTGFALGVRWYFADALFGNRDSIVR